MAFAPFYRVCAFSAFCILCAGTGNVLPFRGVAAVSSVYTVSEDEHQALAEFRGLIDHLLYREFMKSDGYLLRWLVQTNFDVEEALEIFTKFIEWRRVKRVDHVVFEDFTTLDEELPFSINTLDMEGRPVMWSPIGSYDIRKITVAGAEQLYQRFSIRMMELSEIYLHQIQSEVNPNVTQIVGIFDLDGFSMKATGCFKCLKMIPEFISNFELNYPGLFYKSYLINTPKVFQHALSLVYKFMSEKSRQSIQVYGYDRGEWTSELQKQIPVHELPVKYGGTRSSFRSTVAKKSQLNFINTLVIQAKNAVLRDLDEQTLNSTSAIVIDTHDMTDEVEEQHVEHHHHYRESTPSAPDSGKFRRNRESALMRGENSLGLSTSASVKLVFITMLCVCALELKSKQLM